MATRRDFLKAAGLLLAAPAAALGAVGKPKERPRPFCWQVGIDPGSVPATSIACVFQVPDEAILAFTREIQPGYPCDVIFPDKGRCPVRVTHVRANRRRRGDWWDVELVCEPVPRR